MREKNMLALYKKGVLIFILGIFITFLLDSFVVLASNNIILEKSFEKNSKNSNFVIDDNNVLIKYEGFEKHVVIPFGVTKIGDQAFYNCTLLVNIEIPDSVTSIGDQAFWGCTSLVNIKIPDSVTSIGDFAFSDCTSLVNIEIPDSVTSIGNQAFRNCTSLVNIGIPDGVTSIGNGTFYGCRSLTNIEIPDNVTSIGFTAFCACYSLVNIEIPDSVTSISSYAFANCTSLVSIKMPDGINLDYNIFDNSEKVTIYCNSFSNIERYAKLHNIKFRPIDRFGIDVGINNYEKAVENYISVVNSRIKAMLTNHKKMKTKSDKLDEQMIQNIKKKYKISEQYKINGKSKINKISSNERKELETAYWNALYHFTTDNIVEKIDFGDIEASKPIESQTKIVKAVDKYVRNLLKKVNYSTKYKNYNITITTSIAGNYKMVCQDKNGKSYNFYVTISPSYAEEITKDYIEKCIELEISIINSVEIGYLEEASKVLTGYDGIVSWSKSKLEKKVNTTLKKHGFGDINLAFGKYYNYFNYVQKLQKNSSSKEYLKTLKIIYKNADKYLYNSDKITDIVIDDAVDKINKEIKKLKLEAKKALYK